MKKTTLLLVLILCGILKVSAQFPPPPGITPVYFCDDDNDGIQTFDLDYIIQEYFALTDTEISAHPTADDAINDTNEIIGFYTNTTNPESLWLRVEDLTGTTPPYATQVQLNVINCGIDEDMDSIASGIEDLDNDGDLGDHDTDNNGFPNFVDDDDDGDGILTANEDYNGNGDPTDDDINNNGIPDYLDDEATLSLNDLITKGIHIAPNPASNRLSISIDASLGHFDIELFDVTGKRISTLRTNSQPNAVVIDVSPLSNGLYFIRLNNKKGTVVKRVVVNR